MERIGVEPIDALMLRTPLKVVSSDFAATVSGYDPECMSNLPSLKLVESEDFHPITLSVLIRALLANAFGLLPHLKLVDTTGIEPATPILQGSVAPEVHVRPYENGRPPRN